MFSQFPEVVFVLILRQCPTMGDMHQPIQNGVDLSRAQALNHAASSNGNHRLELLKTLTCF
jgi:hypothetical protein